MERETRLSLIGDLLTRYADRIIAVARGPLMVSAQMGMGRGWTQELPLTGGERFVVSKIERTIARFVLTMRPTIRQSYQSIETDAYRSFDLFFDGEAKTMEEVQDHLMRQSSDIPGMTWGQVIDRAVEVTVKNAGHREAALSGMDQHESYGSW